MPLTTIYLTRHGFRLNWTVDPNTGTYSATHSSPTGIPSDPPLAAHGVAQSHQLSTYLHSLSPAQGHPRITRVYSSPFYRCLQTIAPYISSFPASSSPSSKTHHLVRVDNGLGEWYGRARFTHPSPAPPARLRELFSFYDLDYKASIVPSTTGETVEELHDRCAFALARIIGMEDEVDDDDEEVEGSGKGKRKGEGERAILICTHAASMIAIGRALTGKMPEDVCEDDFGAFTCGVSTFRRKGMGREREEGVPGESNARDSVLLKKWEPEIPVPQLDWRRGKGVGGGWVCEVNSYCGHLEDGEERGWHFQGDEAFDERHGPSESIGYKL